MGQVEASPAFDRRDKGTIKARWLVGVTGLAAAMAIAGAIVAFSSVSSDARPAYVTKSKPCGSCHPPNRPPKK
jgi:hypothetical protein